MSDNLETSGMDSNEHTTEEQKKEQFKLLLSLVGSQFNGIVHLPRPPFQLRLLPIPLRWEVTRRHPFYQLMWKTAASTYSSQHESVSTLEKMQASLAGMVLGMIGVNGNPPSPATPFTELGVEDLNIAWLSGAVQPITIQGVIAILLLTLSKKSLGELGLLLLRAGCDDKPDEQPKAWQEMSSLMSSDNIELQSYFEEPIVTVNPAASQQAIIDSINQLTQEWKAERELSDRRVRSDKIEDYLKVWDQREGWNDTLGRYDIEQEISLKEIAQRNKTPVTTIANQYQNAFREIFGHPYRRELWWETMGAMKLQSFDGLIPESLRRRSTKSRSRKPLPTAGLGLNINSIEGTETNSSQYSISDLQMDIGEMRDNGWTELQMAEELGVGIPAIQLFVSWMDRTEDLPQVNL